MDGLDNTPPWEGNDEFAENTARAARFAELWPDVVETKPSGPFQSKFGARWFHEVGASKPRRDWLVKNLLLAKTFGIVYGPPGCGKSFLVTDMCLTVAEAALEGGRPLWFGYKTRPFGIIYVVAEGSDDYEVRLHAWRIDRGLPPDTQIPFVFLPTAIDLQTNDVNTLELAKEIAHYSAEMEALFGVKAELVVIDTVARSLSGPENASEVMTAFVRNCGTLQKQLSTSVLGVHHGGKEGGRGPRGHEALHGAADFEYEVCAATEDSPNTWRVAKLKSGPQGAEHKFRLKSRTVAYDDDGDEITSCVVVSHEGEPVTAGAVPIRPNPTEREFLLALNEAIETRGLMPPARLPVPTGVTLVARAEDVRAIFWARYSDSEAGSEKEVETKLRGRWSRGTRAMLRQRVVGALKPHVWFTGRPVEGVTPKGVVVTNASGDVTGEPQRVTDAITELLNGTGDL